MLSRTFVAGLILAAGASAQTSSFPKPSYFREVFKQNSTQVQLRDPVRLKDFVVNGKLTLSLKEYLELVMANNTSVQVSFLSLEIPRNAITAAFGKWDPNASASFQSSRSTSVPTNPANSANVGLGAVSKSLSQPLSLSFTQAMDTGTSYAVSFNGTKSSFSNSRSSYNPSFSTGLTFTVTQQLIQNRGRYVNRIPVMQAESSLKQSQFNLRSTLLTLVSGAESAYWRVINARETLRVQQGARDASQKNFDFVKQQLSLGAIADLDIYNPQGQLASAEVSLSQAQFSLASAEDALRQQIGADLDADIRKLPIELTEPVDISTDNLPLEPEAEVQKALATNPSMLNAQERLSADELGIQSARNGLLPALSFQARYASNGVGGTFLPSQTSLLGGGVAEPIPGGVGDALYQMFGFGYPTYTGTLTLTLPIRSRSASMTYANSLVTKKTDALNLRNQQETLRLNILNAVTNLKGAVEQLKLAKTQQEIQQKNLEAQNKKYELGTNTNQDVVLALQSKAAADAQYVQSQVGVRTSILSLLTQTGELLDERGIVIK